MFTEVELPFLKIGITLAIFKLSGYTPVLIVRLNSCSRAGANRGAESLTNMVEKPSYPVEFVFFSFFIVSRISDCDV